MVWCEHCEVWGGIRRRQLALEEKAVDGALVWRWGRGRSWVLPVLADAVAAWMWGPPLTDCWRLKLCVPGILCLAPSLSVRVLRTLPLMLSHAFSLSSVLPLCFHCIRYHHISQQHILHTLQHSAKTCSLLTHKKLCTHCTHGVPKLSASNVPKQMAETKLSLFADSCATSCNKKSMNQGQSIYSNNKEREICHFFHSLLFFMKTCLFSLTGEEWGG